MKTILNIAAIIVFLNCSFIKSMAQCSTNSIYNDLIEPTTASFSNSISFQVTIINAPTKDGTHFYSAWGKENFIFAGPAEVGGAKINRCRFTSKVPLSLLYSDRNETFISNLLQPFSINGADKQNISLDIVNNTIISESVTWSYTTTYENVQRIGNIFYASSGTSMIIINILKPEKIQG